VSIAGRAKILLPAFVAAASAAFVAALLVRRGEHPPTIAAPASEPPHRTTRARIPILERACAGRGGECRRPAPTPRPSGPHPGVIRGEVLAAPGAVVPERWTLHVGPHPWLAGHETAADRRIEFEHGETKFELRDLPLGGYLVEAITPDLNCLPGNVMSQGSEDQFVTIQPRRAGSSTAESSTPPGRPAEGLDITLESVPTGDRRTLSTDPAGNFVFHAVRNGEYRLLFGRPEPPLLLRSRSSSRRPRCSFRRRRFRRPSPRSLGRRRAAAARRRRADQRERARGRGHRHPE
jgi:hypothetical protein